LLEVADVFVINKADNPHASQLEHDLSFMMDLSTWPDGWRPPIMKTVATNAEGVEELMQALADHRTHIEHTGELERRRTRRALAELRRVIVTMTEQRAREAMGDEQWHALLDDVAARRVDPWTAAEEIHRERESR
jgi:LAO/AO transport system kinase